MDYAYLDVGYMAYNQAYGLQKRIWDVVYRNDLKGVVILLEHNNVFTLGRSAKKSNILVRDDFLNREGIQTIEVERGGDVTYHGPGQIVVYPILNLKFYKKDLHVFLTNLEEVVINFLEFLGIKGFRNKDFRGVWTNKGKIASLGVAVRKWITFHGIAVNVYPEMKYFSFIKPCSLEAKTMTSIFDFLGEEAFNYKFKPILKRSFEKIFK